jgi:two-component system, NtrC family, response regulator HydG
MTCGVTVPDVASLRLRGEVDGEVRTFLLEAGDNLVGKALACQVVLPLRGVSRRHAVLRIDGESVTVADLGSKNGTRINGRRVDGAPVQPGDRLGFGSANLILERIDAGDAQLALVLAVRGVPPASPTARETTQLGDDPRAGREGRWLAVVDAFLDRLALVPEGDPAGALSALLAGLGAGARGAALVEWGAGEPVVLAAAGTIAEIPALAGPDVSWSSEDISLPSGPRTVSAAALKRRGAEPLGLVVWGDVAATAIRPLLHTLVRLAGRLLPSAVAGFEGAAPPAGQPGLVFPPGHIAGNAPAMVSLYAELRAFAQGDLPVLIVGETGTGKEHIARILHASSRRRRGPLIAINCAAIPSDLLEAELFGIGRNVATGVAERLGKFSEAQGGTLFLDEIGDMPAALQVKLLRALQEGEIQPLGRQPVAIDVRIVASTNADLPARLQDGGFRTDLYYRIAGGLVRVPPLRDRREDLPGLIGHFARTFSREARKPIRGITVKALQTLTDYPWPGNVRELEHEIRRLVYLCPPAQAIESAMLSERFAEAAAAASAEPPAGSLDLTRQLEALERRMIRSALEKTGGNQSAAARLLHISRNGLAQRIKRLGLG